MLFYFYIFFCLLAYRTHQAVQPFGSTAMLLLEIQRILYHEFGEDMTTIPSEDGFLATISFQLEDKEVDQNEECQGENSEAPVEQADNGSETSHRETHREISD